MVIIKSIYVSNSRSLSSFGARWTWWAVGGLHAHFLRYSFYTGHCFPRKLCASLIICCSLLGFLSLLANFLLWLSSFVKCHISLLLKTRRPLSRRLCVIWISNTPITNNQQMFLRSDVIGCSAWFFLTFIVYLLFLFKILW